MPQKITLSDIAKELGVSKATVSRALNDQPKVSEDVRKKIKQKAEEMGYRPDPALRALVQHRWNKADVQRNRYRLALVHMAAEGDSKPDTKPQAKVVTHRQPVFQGLESQIERLGFDYEEHHSGNYDSPQHLGEVLYARGIDGVIFSLWGPEFKWDFPFESFSCIALNYDHGLHRCHCVTSDWNSAVSVTVKGLRGQGAKRIGLVRFEHDKDQIDRRIASAYNYEHQRLIEELGQQPSQFQYSTGFSKGENWKRAIKTFGDWLDSEQPDAIIDGNFLVFWWLKDMGLKIGKDIHLANLLRSYYHPNDYMPAADHQLETQGRWAVNILRELLQNNEKGLSDHPARTSFSCAWHPGYFEHPEGLDALHEIS